MSCEVKKYIIAFFSESYFSSSKSGFSINLCESCQVVHSRLLILGSWIHLNGLQFSYTVFQLLHRAKFFFNDNWYIITIYLLIFLRSRTISQVKLSSRITESTICSSLQSLSGISGTNTASSVTESADNFVYNFKITDDRYNNSCYSFINQFCSTLAVTVKIFQ